MKQKCWIITHEINFGGGGERGRSGSGQNRYIKVPQYWHCIFGSIGDQVDHSISSSGVSHLKSYIHPLPSVKNCISEFQVPTSKYNWTSPPFDGP